MTDIFENYEVVNILGGDIFSTCYKVKNKKNSEIVIWKALDYEDLSDESRELLLAKINQRKLLKHPNLLKFYDYVLHKETNALYIVTEYCKHGNLYDIMQKCIQNDEYLSEDFIWKLLHKVAQSLKHTSELDLKNIGHADIYMDEYYNVKFYYFTVEDSSKCVDGIFNIGKIFYELCSLQCKSKDAFNRNYSECVRDLITFLSTTDLNQAIEIVLHHPTILMKKLQSDNFNMFKKKDMYDEENDANQEQDVHLNVRLENLRNRELVLKSNEQKLKEKEHNLVKREKKIVLMERIVKEKITQANLYLRRSRQIKQPHRTVQNKENYDNMDTSYSADCGDSMVYPTSKKLNVAEIEKPKFTRTVSERRVKFKGHSPLKDLHNVLNKEYLKQKPNGVKDLRTHDRKSTGIKSLPDSEPTSDLNSDIPVELKTKKKFSLASVFSKKTKKMQQSIDQEVQGEVDDLKTDFRPISWTKDNKKQAFKLLRIMNGDQSSYNGTIKHTCM